MPADENFHLRRVSLVSLTALGWYETQYLFEGVTRMAKHSQHDLAPATRHQRADAADRRDAKAAKRDDAAAFRDQMAHGRDAVADAHEAAFDLDRDYVEPLVISAATRDAQADIRDQDAERRELAVVSGPQDADEGCSDAVLEAARQDRSKAREDRELAAADRADFVDLLEMSARPRVSAANDRMSSSADRLDAANDRDEAGDDRAEAAIDRSDHSQRRSVKHS